MQNSCIVSVHLKYLDFMDDIIYLRHFLFLYNYKVTLSSVTICRPSLCDVKQFGIH